MGDIEYLTQILEGRFHCDGNTPLEDLKCVIEEYKRAEDCLPDNFDSEDYCLSNTVKQLVNVYDTTKNYHEIIRTLTRIAAGEFKTIETIMSYAQETLNNAMTILNKGE